MGIKDNIAMQVKIAELQAELRKAQQRIAELETTPQKIVHVPVETVRVEYVDNPALVDMIRKLQDQLRGLND